MCKSVLSYSRSPFRSAVLSREMRVKMQNRYKSKKKEQPSPSTTKLYSALDIWSQPVRCVSIR